MTIGDTVWAALFSKDFPSMKSPEQMHFQQTIEEIINGEEIDSDELSPAEFVSDGEDESDDKTFLEVAEELGILATGLGKRKSDDSGKHSMKKCKTDDKSEEIK